MPKSGHYPQGHPKTRDTLSKYETHDECRSVLIKSVNAGYRHSLDFPGNSEAMRDLRARVYARTIPSLEALA
ncbi:MAG TPA: hypothetical protein VMH37_09620 [Candidatus Binataceae bacterium]|nr:hypothetical protein [Candidatus Binataceae bacterium]